MVRNNRSGERRGSIPLVLMIIVVLGIGAGASIFMTSTTARSDKRAELNQKAWDMAQAAVEEILVRVSNGSANFDDANRYQYKASMTELLANDQGVTLEPVEVLGRLAEAPEDPEKEAEFYALMTIGPGFASEEVLQATDPALVNDPHAWIEKAKAIYTDPAYEGMWAAFEMTPDRAKYQGEVDKRAEELKELSETDPSSLNRRQRRDVAEAFAALEPVGDPKTITDPFTENHFGVADIGAATPFKDSEEAMSSAEPEMAAFLEQWDLAMKAMGEQLADRIANCAGNKNYAAGTMVGSFQAGVPPEADGELEEQVREIAEEAGVLKYRANLLTVQASAEANVAGVKARQTVSAHRLATRTNFFDACQILRNQTLLYLMYHYGVTVADMHLLGWVEIQDDGTDKVVIVKPKMHTKLFERYRDLTGTVVVPFQAAQCHTKARES